MASELETPLGNITVDREITEKLAECEHFSYYTQEADEKEHSLEMHLPYIYKIFNKDITIVPIVVGSITFDKHQAIASDLVDYFKDEDNFFIISTDFCHWGMNFMYMPFDKEECQAQGIEDPTVNQYIEILDKEGIGFVEKQDGKDFQDYLKRTKNTICGRNPITVLLEIIKASGLETITKNVQYKQSGTIDTKRSSSVSYASFYTIIT